MKKGDNFMLKDKFNEEVKEYMKEHLEILNGDKWRNKYHIMPPIGWINDPNGLCEFNGAEVFSTRIYNDDIDKYLKLKGKGTAIVESFDLGNLTSK